MSKKIVSIFLFCFLFLSSLSIKPIESNAIDESMTTKIIFFSNNQSFSLNQNQILCLKKLGEIKDLEFYPSFNAIRITGSSDCIKIILKENPTIQMIDDYQFQSHPIKQNKAEEPVVSNQWNLDLIHIKELWDKGFTGKGIKVGVLDTGVDSQHPALKDKIVDFAYFDKDGIPSKSKEAYDTDEHGTHVSGIIAGGSLNEPLGVAPGATLSVGVVIPGGSGSFSQILGGLQWIMDPDGNPKTNDSPRAVNLSFGMPGYVKIWTPIFNKLLSHNIIPVCSIGNEGDGISSSPGNSPNAFSIGAYDKNKKDAYFSSGSDTIIWEDSYISSPAYLKPDISAPGVAIRSSIPDGMYAKMSGTSMASPHVAGAVAILAEAYPNASAYDIWYFLRKGSHDEGKIGEDTRFGQGSLDVFSSWKLMKEAYQFSGTIKNFDKNYSLYNQDTGLDVHVDEQNSYSTLLLSGTYHFEVRYQNRQIQTFTVSITNKNISMDVITLPKLKFTAQGLVHNQNGKAVVSNIFVGKTKFKTDKNGFFSFPCESFNEITIQSNGYIEQTINSIEETTGFLNVILKKADVLVVEGASQYSSVKNPPRLARNYYFQALSALQVPYAYINTEIQAVEFEDISAYPTVIYFVESGFLPQQEAEVFSKYLSSGGRMIASGRMLLFLDNYIGQTFFEDHFGVTSREVISFPTVSSMNDLDLFKGLQFSLSGNLGANNQENCDIMQKIESSISLIPFLKFEEIGKEKYAGILVSNKEYRSILLSFGFEGIGSSQTRLELLKQMLFWLKNTGSLDIKMPDDAPFYIKLSKDTNQTVSTIIQTGSYLQRNLEEGKYHLLVYGYGYEKFETDFSLQKSDSLSIHVQPKKSIFQSVMIHLKQFSGFYSYLQVFFHGHLVMEKEFTKETSYQFDLPEGEYTFFVCSPRFETKAYKTEIKNEAVVITLEMKQNVKKILLVDDSQTGDFLLDRYARIGAYYSKYMASTKYAYDLWDVSEKGKPDFLALIPYQCVLYITGLSMESLGPDSEQKEIRDYQEHGGNIILTGNYTHTLLQNSEFIKESFGIDVKSSNIREQSVHGVAKTAFADISFGLNDTLGKNGIFVPFGSFIPMKEGVIPLFQYYSGEIASTLYQTKTFRSIFLPFGIDNINITSIRLDLLNRMFNVMLLDQDQTP